MKLENQHVMAMANIELACQQKLEALKSSHTIQGDLEGANAIVSRLEKLKSGASDGGTGEGAKLPHDAEVECGERAAALAKNSRRIYV